MSETNNTSAKSRAKLTPEQRKRILELRRRQRKKKQMMLLGGASALVLIVIVVLAVALPRGEKRDAQQTALALPADNLAVNAPEELDAPEQDADADAQESDGPAEDIDAEDPAGFEDDADAEPAAEAGDAANTAPMQSGTYEPEGGVFVYDDAYIAALRGKETGPAVVADLSKVDPAKADRWPEAKEGYLPLIYSADTTENIIAITVDDCFQADNLQQIVQCALDNNGELTIFPIGSNLARDSVASVVKWAWENGMEIENHTYNHVGLFHYDDERMTNEMWYQSAAVSMVLGVNYQEHFFRPRGGDERNCQRVHAYAQQLGMQGVAIWTQSGSSDTMTNLINNLGPGRIYLFHTTDNDLNKLLYFIPEATKRGYRLVTMNEMFGLPDNETSDISTLSTEKPNLQPFQIVPVQLKKTTYVRAAAIVQERLIELGWLEGDADGVFGQSSYMATGFFQVAADLKADGIAGTATQMTLFSSAAPECTAEMKAQIAAMVNK